MRQKRTTSTTLPDPALLRLRVRGLILMAFCLGFIGTVGGRLACVQATYAEKFSELAPFDNAHTGTIPASRGRILDAKGRPLTDNRIIYTLFVNPSRVPDDQRDALVSEIVRRFACDPDLVQKAIWDTECTYRELKEEMTAGEVQQFLGLPQVGPIAELMREVGVAEREARVYPLGALAGPVLGATDARDEGQVVRWAGFESTYDDVLAGRPGSYEDLRDQRGRRIPGSRREITPARNGSDLMTTLDADVQALAESALQRGLDKTGASGGTIVITEPSTGRVLALASLPAFDPSHFDEYVGDEASTFSRSTRLSFEAGSVMKIFTIAGGLEEGAVERDSMLEVTKGRLRFHGGTVPDHSYGDSVLSLRDVVVHSSNRGAAIVAVRLGRERLTGCLEKFGFGRRTELKMPGEPCGDLKQRTRRLPEIDLANMGFGHGITVSPLQLAQAMGVFANGGVLVPLRLVDGTRDPLWDTATTAPVCPTERVISPETASIMQDFMVGVIETGTAQAAKTQWICAGKTGTAQKVNPDGGYFRDRYFTTFMGYGPVPNPKWLILVVLDDPTDIRYQYGGTAAGPVFREIFNALMLRDGGRYQSTSDGESNADETDFTQSAEEGYEVSTSDDYVINPNPFAADDAADSAQN